MNVTIGYGSGYLAGLLTGGVLGWIFSVFSKENTEEETCEFSSPESSAQDANQDQEKNNVIHIELSDKSFAELLSKARNINLETSEKKEPVQKDEQGKTNEILPFDEEEMTGIFDEEDSLSRKTLQEKLDIGRKKPTRPVAFPTSKGGGYVTMEEISEMKKKHDEYNKESVLTRSEELEIIQAFRGIVGKDFYDAVQDVRSQGYSLHVLYVGKGPKMPAQLYSPTTLGVRIQDDDFQSVPSVDAKITEIIDVGGVDSKNRGFTK